MPIDTTSAIQRWWLTGEIELSQEIPFLFSRYEIPIVSGTATYTLPDIYLSIRRVTYLGKSLDPLPAAQKRDFFQGSSATGNPFWYIFDNIGQNKISLYPAPNQTIAAGSDPWFSDIATKCIVEGSVVADDSTFTVPSYLRQQMIKKYVGYKMYSMEGPQQNLESARYFLSSWNKAKSEFAEWLQEIATKPRKLIINDPVSQQVLPAAPVLPISRYGISVEAGE